MGMREVIESIEHDTFSGHTNPPEDKLDSVADIKIFPDLSSWAVCPFCGKKAIKILPDTRIHKMPYKCKGSKCQKEFLVNLE